MASPNKASPSKSIRSSKDADFLERKSVVQLFKKAWTEKDDEWEKVSSQDGSGHKSMNSEGKACIVKMADQGDRLLLVTLLDRPHALGAADCQSKGEGACACQELTSNSAG